MAIYAIALRPLINQLHDVGKHIWYADDASAVDRIECLKKWWDKLIELGPRYGYFPNASKSLIVVKEEHHEKAVNIFGGSGLLVTTEGNHYLGAPIGNRVYYEQHINDIINTWSEEVKTLASIPLSQPQAAYAG